MASNDEEERLLRSTALQNAQSILIARQRAEEELVRAKEALERKTQELERSEARKTAMFESALDCIISIDHEGTIIEFNASAERTFGYRREDVLGRGLAAAIIPPAYRESHLQGLAHYLATGEGPILNQRLELSAVRADGAEFPVELTVTRIPVDGPPIFTAYLRDITERKRMEDELRQTAADMSEADRRKNEFLAMLAHELRNPLAPIRNAVQVLRLTGGDAQALQSASEMMERQVGQMVRLVDDLLDVSRISRGKIELRKERVELASVVHQAVEAARSLVQCMEHELTISLPPEPIYLNADPVRLAQVLGNLLSNACKFTAKGGRISLTVELEEAEDKEIRRGGDKERQGGDSISLSPPLPLSPSPSHVLIRVRDNGIGLTPDQLPHIFDMFMQVDTSLERTVSGLGIGLTLVKNLAEMHGGTVEVHSGGAGQGSEFVVRLPLWKDEGGRLKDETATDPVHPSAFSLQPSAKRRILVVDDNRDAATSLAMLLKLTGHQTHAAFDGLEAVEAAATFRPDVILLDIGLPKLNGHEACRRIREQPWGQSMRLVALTGWGQEEDRQKSKAAGFNAHLVKPVNLAALTKLLDELAASDA